MSFDIQLVFLKLSLKNSIILPNITHPSNVLHSNEKTMLKNVSVKKKQRQEALLKLCKVSAW
jgi:hypothetical protein